MADEEQEGMTWEPSRLIPVSGIRGSEEQERRATSALLAVLSAVDEFGTTFTKPYGAPKAKLETFIEVPFEIEDERTVFPDGLIRATRGKKEWTALVEVKTGKNELDRDQIETYLDVARDNGIDCVITISNQIARIPGEHPLQVDRRKLRKVDLHHLSWSRVLTEAVKQKSHRGVADIDQAWILGELIRYLEHPNAGAMDFQDMGGHWVKVREATKAGTLRATDKDVIEVAGRWEELLSYIALRLGRELGADVQEVLTRKESADPSLRISHLVELMATNGTLDGGVRIPNAIGDVAVVADLRAVQVITSVRIAAPQEGRTTTRINWLLRQLKNSPDDVRIDAFAQRSRTSMSELLADARNNAQLLAPADGKDLATFNVSIARPMGLKRGKGRRSFIDSVLATIDEFYSEVVQQLSEWQPKAPKLQRPPQEPATPPSPADEPVHEVQQTQPSADQPHEPQPPEAPRAGLGTPSPSGDGSHGATASA